MQNISQLPKFVTQQNQFQHMESVLNRIGNTPLVPLSRLPLNAGVSPGVTIFAKLESFNPGGSVKDRPALNMLETAEREGLLTPDKTILEATSGNTGIGLAMIAAVKGYKIRLVMPANASEERKQIMRAYGAELILTDPDGGIDLSIRTAQQMLNNDPARFYRPDQYNNPANWQAHYNSTGIEILAQTNRQITHFVAGIGTSGTLMGTGRRLRHEKPDVQIVAVEPMSGALKIPGLKHMASSIVPQIYNESFADTKINVHPDNAREMAIRLAREEGLFVGRSAGAALHGALQVARQLESGVVVTLFPDGGEKYLSLQGA